MSASSTGGAAGDQKERIRESFDRKAAAWGDYYGDEAPGDFRSHNFLVRRREVLGMLEPTEGLAVDVGCGTGDFVAPALERSGKVLGIEVSERMALACRERFAPEVGEGRAGFCLGDIESMPLRDGSAQRVVCVGVIEYLLRQEPSLREIARVLSPGGHAIITVPNSASPFIIVDNLSKGLQRAASRLYRLLRGRPRDETAYVHRYMTPWRLNRMVREAGLVVDRRVFCTFGSFLYGNVLPFSVKVSEALGPLGRTFLGILGTNYIVRAARPASPRDGEPPERARA